MESSLLSVPLGFPPLPIPSPPLLAAPLVPGFQHRRECGSTAEVEPCSLSVASSEIAGSREETVITANQVPNFCKEQNEFISALGLQLASKPWLHFSFR